MLATKASHRPSDESSTGTVRMVVGRINVYTTDSPSTVTTDNAAAEIQRKSKVAVDVDEEDRETRVSAYEGSARISNRSGAEVWVQDREQVAAAADGSFSEKRKIPEPPLPIDHVMPISVGTEPPKLYMPMLGPPGAPEPPPPLPPLPPSSPGPPSPEV